MYNCVNFIKTVQITFFSLKLLCVFFFNFCFKRFFPSHSDLFFLFQGLDQRSSGVDSPTGSHLGIWLVLCERAVSCYGLHLYCTQQFARTSHIYLSLLYE